MDERWPFSIYRPKTAGSGLKSINLTRAELHPCQKGGRNPFGSCRGSWSLLLPARSMAAFLWNTCNEKKKKKEHKPEKITPSSQRRAAALRRGPALALPTASSPRVRGRRPCSLQRGPARFCRWLLITLDQLLWATGKMDFEILPLYCWSSCACACAVLAIQATRDEL